MQLPRHGAHLFVVVCTDDARQDVSDGARVGDAVAACRQLAAVTTTATQRSLWSRLYHTPTGTAHVAAEGEVITSRRTFLHKPTNQPQGSTTLGGR